MSAFVGDIRGQYPGLGRGNYGDRLRPAVDRFRATQLRQGSLYSDIRALIPISVLAVIWPILDHWDMTVNSAFLSGTITVRHLLLMMGIIAFWNAWLRFSLYTVHSPKKDLVAEVARITIASAICGAVPLFANLTRAEPQRGLYVAGFTTLGLLIASYLLLLTFLVGAMICHKLWRPKLALVVGSGPRAAALRSRLTNHYSRLQVFGCLDDEYVGGDIVQDRYLGFIDNLAELLKSQPIEVVLIGLPVKSKYDEIQQVIAVCEMVGVESQYMQDIFDSSRARPALHSEQHDRVDIFDSLRHDPKQSLKRVLDLVLSSVLLIVLAPVMLLAAIAVGVSSPGPIFFVQQRYGRNRKLFPMLKFRSMVFDAEERQAALEGLNEAQGPVFKLRSDPRLTRVGSFLRRTSIDELPQLFNVLRGEMSLVGPRPLPTRDVSRFKESRLLRRFSVRPGITCLWQVNGRSDTSFDYWIEQDLKYIDRWSIWLDFKILLFTIPAVLRGSGAV